MTEVPARQLRNETAALLRRVEAGEDITITVRGRPVAVLRPILDDRPRWLSTAELFEELERSRPDFALADELRELNSETTDDLSWR
ncbi:MAG: type II toxin-antitoxin system Phd/YefM family antitoxin [Sporichthyaceae bacterium]|nr:type II toxin-antitoxin system Phd/YefM family antitoxin [Sporichthyaceae bacterium]